MPQSHACLVVGETWGSQSQTWLFMGVTGALAQQNDKMSQGFGT